MISSIEGCLDFKWNSPIKYLVNFLSTSFDGCINLFPFHSHTGQDNLRYLIAGGNTGGAFSADPETGEINVASPLDYETLRSYSLQYSANDGLHVNNTRIVISVTNVNDERPEFADDKYEAMVDENDNNVPRVILTVSFY